MIALPHDVKPRHIECIHPGCVWKFRSTYPKFDVPEWLVTGYLAHHYAEAHGQDALILTKFPAEMLVEMADDIFVRFGVDPYDPYAELTPVDC